jgi:hypothetical protein
VVAFDNLSHLSRALSDDLAVLATGGGLSNRRLYTNDEEHILTAMRPIILGGIVQVVTAPDLLDRTIGLVLPRIADKDRKDEETFWAAFDQARPAIMGALFDAVVKGSRISTRCICSRPRMSSAQRKTHPSAS